MSRLVRGAVRLWTAVKIKRRHQLAPCGDEFLKLLGLREGGAPLGHVCPRPSVNQPSGASHSAGAAAKRAMPPLRSVLLLLTALLPSALPDRIDRNDRNDKVIRIGAFSNNMCNFFSQLNALRALRRSSQGCAFLLSGSVRIFVPENIFVFCFPGSCECAVAPINAQIGSSTLMLFLATSLTEKIVLTLCCVRQHAALAPCQQTQRCACFNFALILS